MEANGHSFSVAKQGNTFLLGHLELGFTTFLKAVRLSQSAGLLLMYPVGSLWSDNGQHRRSIFFQV